MNSSNKLLSDIVAFRTYAKHLSHLGRRESLEETINRDMMMHLERFPKLSRDIVKAFSQVHALKVMPSMRALQFSGEAITKNHLRQYNCSFLNIDDVRAFGEALFILLSGVGVGFSVQTRHTNQLPKIQNPQEEGTYVVHDSIQGWAQALDTLMEAYFFNRIRPQFDLSRIRPKGSYLVTTGAKAPGPEPLRKMLAEVESRLRLAIGRKLRPIEVHDLICIISDAVLAGGIRRAALISLFDRSDEDMLKSKSGEWWVKHPYRARANNSVIMPRNEVTKEEFDYVFKMCQESGAGEPGISFSNNSDMGYNPCFTGDTLVAIADGRNSISIKQLAEESYTGPVYSIQNGGVVVAHCSRVWKTRENSELVRVTLDDGTSVRCTPDHRFMIRNGNFVAAKDLLPGTSLMPFNSYKRKDREYRMITSNLGRDFAQYRHVASYYGLIKTGYEAQHIHHVDGDGTNDVIYNLEIIEASKHLREHKLGRLNPIHGFKNKDSYRSKRREATQGNNNPRSYGLTGADMFDRILDKTVDLGRKLSRLEALEACGVKSISGGRLAEMGYESISEATEVAYARMNHKVVRVEALAECEDVYDLTVDVTHNFAVITKMSDKRGIETSGVFVHNCHEIALQSNQLCNLTTVNQTGIRDKRDFLNRIYSAALLGTLQAAYTDFPYVRPSWKITTESEALLGVSFTGIADAGSLVSEDWLREGAKLVLEVNEKYARKIGINPTARATAVKPEGTSSTVLGSSSGIHARHAEHYLRRVRMNADDALAVYLKNVIPELVEQDVTSSNGVVVTIPQESPSEAILRDGESAMVLFERAMMYNRAWVQPGHVSGDNRHNVSVTISVQDHEWEQVREAMWINRDQYSGISLLPFNGGSYRQAPFESCDKATYEKYSAMVKSIDLREVKEEDDRTNRSELLACVGGVCSLE